MIKYNRSLLLLLFIIASSVASAQNNTNSPYTRYGYGQLADPGSANSRAMGGVAYALRDKNHVNFANPAAYTAVDSLTFIFDGGASLQNTNFSNGTLKQNAKNSSFDYVTMKFRATKWAGISLGMIPYSNVGYKVARTTESTTENPENVLTYTGDGGLHQFYLGAGFRILKNLSIGANISYLWGDINRVMTENFTSDTKFYNYAITNNVAVRSYKLDIGAQYTQEFAKKHAITLGAVFTPGHNLKNVTTITTQLGNDTDGYTTSSQDTTSTCGVPTAFGVGLSYIYDNRLTVAVDGLLQNWHEVLYMDDENSFCKRAKIALGAEFLPNPFGRAYLGHVKYRLGAYYSKPYYKIDGIRAANEFGLTAGLGLPIPRTRSIISLGVQYVQVTGQSESFLDEKTVRLCVGITFNERWFFKRKVQ